VLRDLFRFPGYHLLSQAAVATTGGGSDVNGGRSSSSSQILNGGSEFSELVLNVTVECASPAAIRLRVALSGSTPINSGGAGASRGMSANRTFLSTTVTVSLDRTVVLGSTQPSGTSGALILAVRPELQRGIP
jgi:hypothetical protein